GIPGGQSVNSADLESKQLRVKWLVTERDRRRRAVDGECAFDARRIDFKMRGDLGRLRAPRHCEHCYFSSHRCDAQERFTQANGWAAARPCTVVIAARTGSFSRSAMPTQVRLSWNEILQDGVSRDTVEFVGFPGVITVRCFRRTGTRRGETRAN